MTVHRPVTDLVDELSWRGLIAQSTDLDALRAELAAGPVTFYYGIDPTAPSLQVGNLVGLLVLRRLQRAGHRPIALAGGATGFIGDPGGRTAERTLLSADELAHNVARLRSQLERFVDFSGGSALLVDNTEWTAPLSTIDFLRDVGKHFSVNAMLAKESVSARLRAGGISFTEFSYMLLQANDYLQLYRRHGCRLQIGGSDQWGNLTAGLDLIRRVEGTAVHALCWPLVTTASGHKLGKTAAGGLWLDAELTSPYAFYQFWMNVGDREVVSYLKLFGVGDVEQVSELERVTAKRPAARTAQRVLAQELTTLVHGSGECGRVATASRALFGTGALADIDEPTLSAALAELPSTRVGPGPLPPVVDLFATTGLCASRSDARRLVREGGAYLNNHKVDEYDAVPGDSDLLYSRWLVLRRGKHALAGVHRTQ